MWRKVESISFYIKTQTGQKEGNLWEKRAESKSKRRRRNKLPLKGLSVFLQLNLRMILNKLTP